MGMLLDLALRATTKAKPLQPEAAIVSVNNLANESPLDPDVESRRQSVVELLVKKPGARYALLTEAESDPEAVILALAIRGRATCELRIPKARYDPFLLMALVDHRFGEINLAARDRWHTHREADKANADLSTNTGSPPGRPK